MPCLLGGYSVFEQTEESKRSNNKSYRRLFYNMVHNNTALQVEKCCDLNYQHFA